ncbi:LysR substrate binding domain-containing protein [Azotobacter beijerinckii]|uniref:LysR substrate binding domain-containing protein n=1 Tax=Azotobacter beijerinckii TaxID=170623 RepID=A0A1H6XIS5_9GAMM|nr:LysR substrate binding domain-containing protein [Azotobacter beijerinckii]
MESAFRAIEQEDSGSADTLSGLMRIGATEGYGVDLLAVPRMVRLSRHEADIVITRERPERGPYIITKLTDYVLRLYASPDYLAAHPPIRSRDDLRQHSFVSYIEDLLYSKELHYLDDIGRPLQVALRWWRCSPTGWSSPAPSGC